MLPLHSASGRALRELRRSAWHEVICARPRLDKRAADHAKKAADIAKKLADYGKKQSGKAKAMEAAEREAQRRRDQEDTSRRLAEKRHAQDVARLSHPTVHHVREIRTIEPPKPERLRVLYLAANPEMDLRVDAEVRQVRAAVRRATHRDLVDIDIDPQQPPKISSKASTRCDRMWCTSPVMAVVLR